MVPGDMYEWSRVIFAKKSKFHVAGGPDTVVSPTMEGAAHPIVKRDVWAKTRHFDASNPEDVDFTIHQVKINGV